MENRSVKELYKLTLDEFKIQMMKNNFGLCTVIFYMRVQNIIGSVEYDALANDLEKNLPQNNNLYKWPLYDRQSRIEFLENRIKELSKIN